MDAHAWQAIVALATLINLMGGGIIRYLLKELEKRDARIEKQTDITKAISDTGERMTSQIEKQSAQIDRLMDRIRDMLDRTDTKR